MANQIIIDIGAVANDGTGDPLRTAFNYVNNNFSNIWTTGIANSNISFSGNKILTTNVNGNLVLAPNGIGKVQANVDIIPNANNTLSLGSLTRQWNTVYAQNLAVGGNVNFNNLTVGGNLTVVGNTIQIGNIVTDTKTIQLANTAGTTTAANGSGVTVGANDNIATMLYNSTSNTWVMNIGANITGNVTASYFIGNGSLLTGIASYSNANVSAYLPTYTGNLSGGNLLITSSGNTWTIADKTITAPGGAVWYSNPAQSTDDFISAPGSNIRIRSIDGSNTVESQINLTSTNIEIVVNNGVSRTWQFNESGVSVIPGDIIPVTAGGSLANIGNVTNPWSAAYVSGNVSAGNISLTGQVSSNLIPTGNNVQSLGNNTNRWSNLYLSGNTIYLGNLSLSAGADGLTSTTGFDLGNSVATDITANVLSANTVNIGTGAIGIGDDNFLVIETLVPGGFRPSNDDTYLLGNTDHRWSEVHANVYYGDGSQLTGINLATYIIANGNSSVVIPSLDGPAEVIVNDNTWSFDTAGNLTLPRGGIVYETNIPGGALTGNTIALKPQGGTNADQQLLIYPTALGADANHLHLTSGNLYNTELFLGNDDLYVKLANTGNIVINSNDGVGNAAQWTFNNFGTLTLPGGSRIRPLGANLDIFAGTGSYVNLITSDESSSMGVDGSGGYIVTAGGTWGFSTTGNLTAPGNISATGNVSGAYILGNGSQLTSLPTPTVTQDITSNGAMSIMTYDGNIKYNNYATVEPSSGNISGGNILTGGLVSATGNISGGNLITTGNLVFSSTQVQSSAYAGGNGHAMMIDTNRTDTYVEIGSADKPFKTFAAAIAAVATLNPTGTVPYTFILMGCNINETVDFTPYNFNFITISTTCRSVFNDPVIFGNSALLQLTVRNVEFGDTVTITGDGTTNQLNNTSFYNVSFTGALTVTAANALAFYEAAFFSTVTFNNVNYCYVNGAQFNDDWTIRVDNSGAYPVPSGGAAPGVVLALDFIANDINFVKGGTGAGVFQPQASRMGRTGQTYALPAGWILTAYSSAFLGTWTNNGTWTMRNSVNLVDIANTLPTYSGTIGGQTVHMEPVAYSALVARPGSRAFVNNGNLVASGNFGAQVIGGGANVVPVWSDGTNWYIG